MLFILCHGHLKKDASQQTFAAFESDERPYVCDEYDEKRLLEALASVNESKIDAIVLSTCHSERLGKILLKHINPPPAIIAINT